MSRPDHLPDDDTQQYRLLRAMLDGEVITPIVSIVEHNVFIPAARCAELRALGWPVRTMRVPHPNPKKFPKAGMTAYFLDNHFRRWMRDNPGTSPKEYPFDEGRGKFAKQGGPRG